MRCGGETPNDCGSATLISFIIYTGRQCQYTAPEIFILRLTGLFFFWQTAKISTISRQSAGWGKRENVARNAQDQRVLGQVDTVASKGFTSCLGCSRAPLLARYLCRLCAAACCTVAVLKTALCCAKCLMPFTVGHCQSKPSRFTLLDCA